MQLEKIDIKDKPFLTIEEASNLFNIGRHKIRSLTASDDCPYILYVGNKGLIKRKEFEEFLSKSYSI